MYKSLRIPYLLVPILMLANPMVAQSQIEIAAQGDRPSMTALKSPEFGHPSRKTFTAREWAEIEASIKVRIRSGTEPPSGMLDRLTVRWYVHVKNPDDPRQLFLLTRDVQHVNVPIDEDFYSAIYISPSSIRRITGRDRTQVNRITERIGYEVIFNGEVVASAVDRGSRDQWWTLASEIVSESDIIPLLTKPETPFAAFWWDRYAEVAPER